MRKKSEKQKQEEMGLFYCLLGLMALGRPTATGKTVLAEREKTKSCSFKITNDKKLDLVKELVKNELDETIYRTGQGSDELDRLSLLIDMHRDINDHIEISKL